MICAECGKAVDDGEAIQSRTRARSTSMPAIVSVGLNGFRGRNLRHHQPPGRHDARHSTL